ncbi:MAG: hypothetical protein ACKPEO_07525 [Sphaerospermopsis kisseleviana]|jgi:hypothetical protein|uniref:Uncharacterized protein n=2 Tax=Sphaerospermopsis TaxID=752201 RepID=A0A479ZW07_9CYAN|nr:MULTISPECIES: hypothetical protein [Sphaerospermopsis]BAZ82080.1 hypothetical protein NIES73_33500 [Sphaerospermopsis kisseleviana NIES-73]MBD2134467.1 hypothetical protein [Sphaerospermopsis sp. FACHB-1094]MBD2145127.1 hypothetical protein [Sphaerospermopsis sp. FACHB-1194]MDB9441983.1 hypothetical protein [Sphaerospermopsis kisseleviana CS-549]GCL35703.1 hypothetical protein SR1949_08000 [Sphaerospermopsis reniformis]
MFDFINNPEFRDFLYSLNTNLNFTTALAWLAIAVILSMVGGAIGGMILAGKDLGYKFSATIGSLFAPAGVIPTLILGLLILNLLGN